MPHTPPTKHLRKKELMDANRFYRLLGEQCNFVDRDTIFSFYMGLVALVGQELRQHKIIRLPHLGEFALITQKPKTAWVGKAHVVIGAREILKFYPKERLRRYFNSRQGPLRYLEILPPAPFK